MMREDFLHYIWKLQLLSHADMRSTDHESITIINQVNKILMEVPIFSMPKLKLINSCGQAM
jgi:hypothetical protein